MRYEIIPFDDHHISAVETDGTVWVVMKPCVEALGLAWHGQFERIKRHPVLSEGIRVTRIPSQRGEQETTCLDLERFHGWLVTISAERIADPQKREAVIRYQRQAFRAIFEHFHGPMQSRVKHPPVRELIALTRERQTLLARLARTTDDLLRRELHTDITRITERLGGTLPPLNAFDDALRHKAERETGAVFAALNTLDALNIPWNLHRRPETFIAFNPAMLTRLCRDNNIPLDLDRPMIESLKLSHTPRFIAYRPYTWSGRKAARCLIFERSTGNMPINQP